MSRSAELIRQYSLIHAMKRYGTTSEFQLGFVRRFIDHLDEMPKTILDYGCGQSRLVDWLAALTGAVAYRYDPAIPEFATLPVNKADMVICTDVLEHIPEEDVPAFLANLSSISQNVFLNVALSEAREVLPNGENAHCTVKPIGWWKSQLDQHFEKIIQVLSYTPAAASFVTWEIKPRSTESSVGKPMGLLYTSASAEA